MSHSGNVTIEGTNARNVSATTNIGLLGHVYVYNDGDWVLAHAFNGNARVHNYSGTVRVMAHDGDVKVRNHGEAVEVETFDGHVTIESDRGNVNARTRSGTIDVIIQAQSYSGDVQVKIDRRAGHIQVTINGSVSQAQVTVVVGEETFTETIESGPISVRLTEQELVINEQPYEVRPSSQVGGDHHQQQSHHPHRRRWYDLRFWRFGRRQRSGRS